MNKSDADAMPKDQAVPRVSHDGIGAELLYPVAGFLVVIVLWLFWIFAGADMVRDRIEQGAATRSGSVDGDPAQAPLYAAGISADDDLAVAGHGSQGPFSTAPDRVRASGAEKSTAISDRFSQLGQTGDLFGGVNALFAAMALIGVFWAATMQWRSLTEGRRATAEQRFEMLFFELLRLTREVLERIEVPSSIKSPLMASTTAKSGASALNGLANRHFTNFQVDDTETLRAYFLQTLVNVYKKRVYGAHPSALGPYFRLLFQTFDLVATAKIDEEKRVQYANIARGQISDGAVLLLALNGLTWRGRKFVPLIERFGLLEHMHQRYLRTFRSLLRMAYRERAFQGSELRAKYPTEPAPEPGPNAFDPDPASPDFEITAPISIPPEGL